MSITEHYSPAELAEKLHVSESFVKSRAYNGDWPHLRLGQRTVVFTEAHYAEIVQLTERTPRNRRQRKARRANISHLLERAS